MTEQMPGDEFTPTTWPTKQTSRRWRKPLLRWPSRNTPTRTSSNRASRRCRSWRSSVTRTWSKSTLVNRILGRREAVVQDVPGVTACACIHRGMVGPGVPADRHRRLGSRYHRHARGHRGAGRSRP